jgi:prevent-host-death family protein
VESISVSKFKATCLAVLQRVKRTRRPVRITRFGKPVADLVPTPPPDVSSAWLGSMAGRAKIDGDVVTPAADPEDWAATRR